MSDTRSDRVHALWFESSARFDYYLTGLSVALIAYWGKNLSPPTAAISRDSLLAVALLVLLVSVLLGLLRMEKDIRATGLNFEHLYLSEQAQILESASTQGPVLHDMVHGADQTPAQVKLRAERYRSASKQEERRAASLALAAQRLYMWRGRTLAAGLLLAIASRLWPTG